MATVFGNKSTSNTIATRGDIGPTGPQGIQGNTGASPFIISGLDSYYNTGGNIGINNTSPIYPLDVDGGAIRARYGQIILGTSLTFGNFTYANVSGSMTYNASNYHTFNKKVGLQCTPNSNYALDVSGNIRCSADTSSLTFTTTSDYRIKFGVISLKNTDYTLDNLLPVTYFNSQLGKKDFGFIAHEVQEIFPSLVSGVKDELDEDGNAKFQGIQYSSFIALIVNEIQMLKEEVKILKNNVH